MVFKKIFHQKLKANEILFQIEGALSTHACPFPNHHNSKGKGQVLKVYAIGRDVDRDLPMQPDSETDFEKMAQRV